MPSSSEEGAAWTEVISICSSVDRWDLLLTTIGGEKLKRAWWNTHVPIDDEDGRYKEMRLSFEAASMPNDPESMTNYLVRARMTL